MDAQPSVDQLIDLVATSGVIGHRDDGDNWGLPVYNTEERLEAADELAQRGAREGLPVLEQFFVEGVLNLNTSHDSDPEGFHHFVYPSELRRLAQAILALGGDEVFDSLMEHRVLPALEQQSAQMRVHYSEAFIQKETSRVLAILQRDFGTIGRWSEGAAEHSRE